MFDLLYQQKCYQDIVSLLLEQFHDNPSLSDLTEVDLAQAAIASFRVKHYALCDRILQSLDDSVFETDYLLNEIATDRHLSNNLLDLAMHHAKQALKINPKLVALRYKYLILNYRLYRKIDDEDVDFCISHALKRENGTWLRDIAMVLIDYGDTEKSRFCMRKALSFGYQLRHIDQLLLFIMTPESLAGYQMSGVKSIAWEAFEKSRVADQVKFQGNENGDSLYVIFSPHEKYILEEYELGGDVLYVKDSFSSYYLFGFDAMMEKIVSLIKRKDYKKVSLIGTSKGATGALIIYQALSEVVAVPISVLACAPQVEIYPMNTNLKIPSYQRLCSVLDISSTARMLITHIKQPTQMRVRAIDKVTVVYGKYHKMDSVEAKKLVSIPNVEELALDFSGHAVLLPLVLPRGCDRNYVIDRYAAISKSNDADLIAIDGKAGRNLAEEIWDVYSTLGLSLRELI